MLHNWYYNVTLFTDTTFYVYNILSKIVEKKKKKLKKKNKKKIFKKKKKKKKKKKTGRGPIGPDLTPAPGPISFGPGAKSPLINFES